MSDEAINKDTRTQEEIAADLRSLSEDISKAENSEFQPACIAAAFATPQPRFMLTMQVWIDLDYIRSPLLQFLRPQTIDQLDGALAAFGHRDSSEMTPEEMASIADELLYGTLDGFSTALGMRPQDAETEESNWDGFGSWAPLYVCLVTQAGIQPENALRFPVKRAYVLISTMRRNQGWEPSGIPYALRDLEAANKE